LGEKTLDAEAERECTGPIRVMELDGEVYIVPSNERGPDKKFLGYVASVVSTSKQEVVPEMFASRGYCTLVRPAEGPSFVIYHGAHLDNKGQKAHDEGERFDISEIK